MTGKIDKKIGNDEITNIKCYKGDKDFLISKELQEYLIFKHKKLCIRQEDLVNLIRLELEEIINK